MSRRLRIYVPLALYGVFLMLPFLWMLLTAFKSDDELLHTQNPFLIAHFTFSQFTNLLTTTAYVQWFANTLFVSVAATVLSVFVSYITAYAIIRLRFPGAEVVSTAIFLAYIVPPAILFIPLATVVISVHWFDKLWALVLIYATFLVPFCTWLLIGFLKNIPRELEEAARVDGASNFTILWRIVFPIAIPGLISAAIFSFTLSWNEYLYALVFMSSSVNKTVSVGMTSELIRGDQFQWGQLMAGALIGVLPAVLVYFFFVEYYVAGMAGSVKE
ncbi:MAG TPA: carbohydrate ABC transporter permease [Candidatus Elarobacter sp.]|jgi:multiple sugar transport system permease protein|nr:carbohydrate ABC transporter permease [Candidatus Elarobacter sp.]